MDIKEFSTLIKEKAKELDDMAKHRLPVKSDGWRKTITRTISEREDS